MKITPSKAAESFHLAIPEGSYLGRIVNDKRDKIHMIIRSYRGCNACFVAIVLKDKEEMVAYRGTALRSEGFENQHTSTQYALTPFSLNIDQQISPTRNPSLVINAYRNITTREVEFSIVNANAKNEAGFQNGMIFSKGRSSPFRIMEPLGGSYFLLGKNRQAWATLSLTGIQSEDYSRTARFTWFGSPGKNFADNGIYDMIEIFPNVFTFNGIQYLAQGDHLTARPTFLMFFLKKRNQRRIVLIDPNDSHSILNLVEK